MVKHIAYDYDELNEKLVQGNVGDFVDFEPENQEGIVHYKILQTSKGKELEKIGDYFSDMLNGGRRKMRNSKMNKSKRNKSKRNKSKRNKSKRSKTKKRRSKR
jgi:hypothetical protein